MGGGGTKPNCFVAGTQVVIAGGQLGAIGEVSARPEPLPELRASDAETWNRWLWSMVVVGVGIVGYRAGRSLRWRDEDEAAERAATEALFHELEEDDMRREGMGDRFDGTDAQGDYMAHDESIDELCDELFHANVGHVSNLPYSVGWAPPTSAVAWAPSAKPLPRALCMGAVAIAPRPIRKQIAPVSRRQPTRFRSRPVPRSPNRIGIVWVAACVLFAGWLGFGTIGRDSTVRKASDLEPRAVAAAESVLPATALRTKNIEDIRVGDRVVAGNPEMAEDELPFDSAIDPVTWKLVRLRAEDYWDDGTVDIIDVDALQPPEWLHEHQAKVGAMVPIPLDLVEMDMPAEMHAEIVAIEPCPEIEDGAGRVVLTTVNHLNRIVMELTVRDVVGDQTKIRPTAPHRFYSDTRRDWVATRNLQPGEVLRGLDGPLTVVGLERVPGTHRVYNMTVEGEHVYRVSKLGALVHNSYSGPLMPGGKPIGTPGNSPGVQTMPGGQQGAQTLFNSQPGTPYTPASYPGAGKNVPGGGWIGVRPASKSGGPVIDVNIPDVPYKKIHFGT